MKKIALVTGGSGGIGSAVCRSLAAAGYTVGVGYFRSREKAEALAKEIGKSAKEGVTQGVDGHVAVGMGYEAHGRVDFQPAEPHREALAEGVDVVSLADSEHVILYRRIQGRPWP